jgi:hypothetical protein
MLLLLTESTGRIFSHRAIGGFDFESTFTPSCRPPLRSWPWPLVPPLAGGCRPVWPRARVARSPPASRGVSCLYPGRPAENPASRHNRTGRPWRRANGVSTWKCSGKARPATHPRADSAGVSLRHVHRGATGEAIRVPWQGKIARSQPAGIAHDDSAVSGDIHEGRGIGHGDHGRYPILRSRTKASQAGAAGLLGKPVKLSKSPTRNCERGDARRSDL